MKKKGIIGIISGLIILGIILSVSLSSDSQSMNFEPRLYGQISTEMGSSIVGNVDAPVTIIEFGDYQCHQCYNWFHNTKIGRAHV